MNKKSSTDIATRYATEILNSIAEGVFTVDTHFKITSFNKAAQKITGVNHHDTVGRYCFEVLRSNLCESTCPIKQSYRSNNPCEFEANFLRSDGKQIPVSICASQLKNAKGELIGGVETFKDLSTIIHLRKEIKRNYSFEDIVSKNHKILSIFSILPNIAESECTVLINGPSGSGKELFARAIHNLSPRKDKPFVAINCGALPDTLLESELFGYSKGAFTDAKKDKPGRFALAKGGTLFLDEVESLSPATQVKLLRVLQEKEFEPLGSVAPVRADVRILSASKADLLQLVNQGKFRDDLFFRLNIVKIELPALRERRDDIPLLIKDFIEKFNAKTGKIITGVTYDVTELLMKYDFPGNIRELENIVEHAFVMCPGETIDLKHLPAELLRATDNLSHFQKPQSSYPGNSEKILILTALEKYNWNKIETARQLGLHRTTLWRKLKKYNLI